MVVFALTRDCVLVTVTLTDANQEGAIFVLGSEQKLLSFHPVYVPVIPPAQRDNKMENRDRGMNGRSDGKYTVTMKQNQ